MLTLQVLPFHHKHKTISQERGSDNNHMKIPMFLKFETVGNYLTKFEKIYLTRQKLSLWKQYIKPSNVFSKIPQKRTFNLVWMCFFILTWPVRIEVDRKTLLGIVLLIHFLSKENGRRNIKGLIETDIWRSAGRHQTEQALKSGINRNLVHV